MSGPGEGRPVREEGALEALGAALGRRVRRRDLQVFCGAFISALLVHLYMFTHKFINHDDLDSLFGDCGFALSSGRWLLKAVYSLTGAFSSAWIHGVCGALYLALAAVFVARVFRLRQLAPSLAVGFTLAAFPAAACTYAYMFAAPPYFFALCLAAMGAYLLTGRGKARFVLGALAIAMSMGCYQAYFGLAAALLVAALIVDVGQGRRDGGSCLAAALRGGAGLALGIVLYFIILWACLAATGVQLTDYQGISAMGRLTPQALLERVAEAYKAFIRFPKLPWLGAVHGYFPFFLGAVTALLYLAALAIAAARKLWRKPAALAFFLLLLAALPLAANIVYVMAEAWTVHDLMRYPMVTVWLLPAVLADRITLARGPGWPRRCGVLAAAAALSVTLLCGYEGALISGKAYMGMELTYESAYSYLTRLAAKIELQEGFTPGTPVAFIGEAQMPSPIDDGMTGVFIGQRALNIYSRGVFLRYFMGTEYGWVSDAAKQALMETAEFAAMPCYPAEGSIRTVDGTVVVKLSA